MVRSGGVETAPYEHWCGSHQNGAWICGDFLPPQSAAELELPLIPADGELSIVFGETPNGSVPGARCSVYAEGDYDEALLAFELEAGEIRLEPPEKPGKYMAMVQVVWTKGENEATFKYVFYMQVPNA